MARRRAADYEAKRQHLLKVAARLFASHGYERTSLAMIGAAAGVAKSLVYHYHSDKNSVLADLLRHHLEELVATVEAAAGGPGNPAERLARMAAALLERYRDADAEHQVQIAQLRLLPEADRAPLLALERRLVARFSEALVAAEPALADDRRHLKPLVMSLFGMVNWAFLWFREDGPLDRRSYALLATRLVLQGAREIAAGREPAGRPLLQAAS